MMIQDTPVKGRDRLAREKSAADLTREARLQASREIMTKVTAKMIWYMQYPVVPSQEQLAASPRSAGNSVFIFHVL